MEDKEIQWVRALHALETGLRVLEVKFRGCAGVGGLTSLQWRILKILEAHEHISQSALSGVIERDKGNISRCVVRLIKKGLVSKELRMKNAPLCLTTDGVATLQIISKRLSKCAGPT